MLGQTPKNEIDTLASIAGSIAGLSKPHFPRVFRKTI